MPHVGYWHGSGLEPEGRGPEESKPLPCQYPGVDKGDGVLNYIQSRFGNLTSQVVSAKYKIAVVLS